MPTSIFTTMSPFQMEEFLENIIPIFKVIIYSFYQICSFRKVFCFVFQCRFGRNCCHIIFDFYRTSILETIWTKTIHYIWWRENRRKIVAPTFTSFGCISTIESGSASWAILDFYNIHAPKIVFARFLRVKSLFNFLRGKFVKAKNGFVLIEWPFSFL